MSRIRIQLPEKFQFSTTLPIRITDLNYGGHVGNDTILSLIHEARVQFLQSLGYSELKFEGVSLIMADAGIEFRAEVFYGDVLTAMVTASGLSRVGFELYYQLLRSETVIAIAKTGMVCYNYQLRKIVALPEEAAQRLNK
jgi:acyl-CoA thioester hydrolase